PMPANSGGGEVLFTAAVTGDLDGRAWWRRCLRAQLAERRLAGLEAGADVAEAIEVGDAHELGQVEQDALLALVAADLDVAALGVALEVAALVTLGDHELHALRVVPVGVAEVAGPDHQGVVEEGARAVHL